MSRLAKRFSLLLTCFLLGVAPGQGWDRNWTAVTLARDGAWGAACRTSQSHAIADAIRYCKAMSPSSDCGAQFETVKGGWVVAELCGDHKIIGTGDSLHAAERDAINREIGLQLFYVPDLPACRRVVTVDPEMATVTSSLQVSAARSGMRP